MDDPVAVRLADVLDRLPAVDQIEGVVRVAPQVHHGVKGELHRPELGDDRLPGRPALVDLVSFLHRQVDDHQLLERIGVSEVDQRPVWQPLVRATEIEDPGGGRQPGHELAAAHVHGQEHIPDGHPATELLGVGQRLRDTVA